MRSQVDELIPEAEDEFEKSSFPVLFCDVRFRPKKMPRNMFFFAIKLSRQRPGSNVI